MHLNNQETENFSYDVFISHSSRHAEYWQQQAYSVMLVIRTSEGSIRWMDVSVYRTYAFETLFSISVDFFCIVYSILTNIRYAAPDYRHSNA